MKPPGEELIYSPAVRREVGLLIMISGGPGSGKTKSALRLATGLAQGGPIGFCDTEHGRGLYYADDFEFSHLALKEPFNPRRFELAAVASQLARHRVWICDSFSHEHVGPGGVLDMQEANLQRMAGDNYERRDQLKYTAWIAPKGEHKHLLQRLWQLNMHIILCCQAEKKLDLIKNDKGKTVPNPDALPSPICAPDIPYAMTASFLLDAKRPGVPQWLKRFDKIEPLISVDRPLDEATGERLAAWAQGKRTMVKGAGVAQPETPPPKDPAETAPPEDPAETAPPKDPAVPDDPSTTDDAGHMFPGDLPLQAPPPSKNEVVLLDLIQRFEAVQVRADYHAITDNKVDRDRIAWFKRHKPDLYKRLRPFMEESWRQTELARDEQAA